MKLPNEEVIITNDNKDYYKNLQECYRLSVKSDVNVELPNLTNVVDLFIHDNCVVIANNLNVKEYLRIGEYSSLQSSTLNKVDKLRMFKDSYLQAKNLVNINQLILYKNALLDIPALKEVFAYRSVDYRLFTINGYYEKEGFDFYKGVKIESIKDNKILYYTETYLVQSKEDVTLNQSVKVNAHGISEEIAIENLNFKIKNKNYNLEILEKDTILNIEHFKLFV